MSSNPPQGGQSQPGQPQARRLHLYKPDDLAKLPSEIIPDSDRARYAQGLTTLWKTIDTEPSDSQQSQDAKKRLLEFSKNLQLRIEKAQAAQRTQAQAQGQTGAPSQSSGAAPQQRQPSANLIEHINRFKYVLPAHIPAGSEKATQWLQDAKNRYGKALMTMENTTIRSKALDAQIAQRKAAGPLTPEEINDFKAKREAVTKQHMEAKKFVDQFRVQQAEALKEQVGAASNAPAQQTSTTAQQPATTTTAPVRPPMTAQQQPQSQPNTALQSTQAVNAAIEAARNQQMNGGRPQIQTPTTNAAQQTQHPPIGSAQNNSAQQPATVATPTSVKQEGASSQPQPGASAPAAHPGVARQQSGPVNSPQTAGPQSAGPQAGTPVVPPGPPRALTQQAALQAARTYSSGNTAGTPNLPTHSHPTALRDTPTTTPNVNSSRPAIAKQLPEKLTLPPQPVVMQPPRPTISGGPTAAAAGVLGQPAIQKPAGFTVEGEGDRVMNKKKLDELVRQVCGGQFENGEGLSPELEESMLQVADEFVDNVITAACKCAKARGSKNLEIRDLQLVLERNYNIRIPGYATDELRTVRKFQPAQGWVAKMSAVQAAKVTGGKSE